jgi:aryl-alcohol dehydrogenase-like predicted oxidoreductase
MRYRPLGKNGTAISALTIVMPSDPTPRADVIQLVYSALESGINAFEFSATGDLDVLRAGCEALKAVERDLVLVGLRLDHEPNERDLSPATFERAIKTALGEAQIERLDLVVLDCPAPGDSALPIFQMAEKLRDARRLRLLGVVGDGADLDRHIDEGRFDLVSMPFHIGSGWVERNRLKRAIGAEMIVTASSFMPPNLPAKEESAATRGLKRLIGKGENPAYQAYEFLYRSPDWSAEQICLGFTLTEPSLASVRIHCSKADQVQAMAPIPDKEMPNGVPARIEMARFSLGPEAERA